MKFKTYVCIQEDCGEICKHESVLGGDRHPKPPEFCPYYGGPCKWEGIDLADEADQPPENLTRDNCFHVSEDGERWTSYLSGPDRWRAGTNQVGGPEGRDPFRRRKAPPRQGLHANDRVLPGEVGMTLAPAGTMSPRGGLSPAR